MRIVIFSADLRYEGQVEKLQTDVATVLDADGGATVKYRQSSTFDHKFSEVATTLTAVIHTR